MVSTIVNPTTPSPLNWSYTPEELRKLTDKLIEDGKQFDKQIEEIPDDECSFETVIAPLGRKTENESEVIEANIDFFQHVSPNKDLRDASAECSLKLQEFGIERSMNKKIYQKVAKVVENIKSGKFKAPENPEDQRLLEKMELDYRRSGLALPDDKLAELKELKKKLTNISIEFSRSIAEDKTTRVFTKKELDGLSEDFFENLEKTTKDGEEAYVVDMKYPSYFPILKLAKSEETRKAMMLAYGQRCKPNLDRLKEALSLRIKMANILGYPSHSHFKLETKMAKNPKNVLDFLQSLKEKLQPLGKEEIKKLLELKKQEKEELNQPYDGILHDWDLRYYNRMLIEKEYAVKDDEIKQYLPINEVTEEMLGIYEKIFSIKCVEIKNPVVWHPDVRQLEIYDKKTNDYMGTVYLDLHPREGKYTHAACFGLASGYDKEDGSHAYPVAAMVANFSKPTATKPSLLKHSEVTTYYHELGHVFHQICSHTKWSRFHGTNVERDFVEAPSQMLENWCWEEEVLEILSHHYQDKSKKLPKDLIQSLIKTKNVNAAIFNLRQIFYGTIDMKLHTMEKVDNDLDLIKVYDDLRKEVMMIENMPDTWPITTFDHIMSGYDSGYYGYLWSEVFSADMYFSKFKPIGILNPEVGEKYRNIILKNGGSRDAMELLKEFLGREPNNEAFLKSLGI
ncbi:hypothetical protein PIROE2DRAFT_54875 [Piromyces sp. E2]|nr:hypothetical protein PIROE2DRAFT_54875 [Piromyces sp. E2]|eukprot:OUM59648.1 hypothetical protein PIROE2DRAFT_54875 [Piromyces sp. E2]